MVSIKMYTKYSKPCTTLSASTGGDRDALATRLVLQMAVASLESRAQNAEGVMSELKTKWPGSIAEYFGAIGGSRDHRAWTWTDRANYQRARADAAIERLLGAAKIASDYRDGMTSTRQCAQQLEAWLEAIGP